MKRPLFSLGLVSILLIACATRPGLAAAEDDPADLSPDRPRQIIEEVSTSEVKRFLDPFRMINRVEYKLQANYLPQSVELYTNRIRPWIALNNSNAVWIRVPYRQFSLPNADGPSGIGDIAFGWGFLVHENLERRLTAIGGAIDVLLPTGDASEGLGFDTYLIAPAAGLVMNPTDTFPVYLIARYLRSLESSRELRRDVQTLELTLQTFHIMPKGFYLAFLPTLFFDLEQDFDVFSLGLAAGRALNRRFALQVGYVQHMTGEQTFNRGFQVGLNFLWGKDQGLGY